MIYKKQQSGISKGEVMINHSFYNQLLTKDLYKNENKCPYYNECSSSISGRNKSRFYRTRIGSNYDNEPIKILVVGQEDVGEAKEYICCEPCTMEEAGYNPHYLRTFYSVAHILLNEDELPEDYSKQNMCYPQFEELRHSFALTNYYKCVFSDNANNSNINHSKIMERNCSENLIKEIEILNPDILIMQGKNHKTFWNNINYEEVPNTLKTILINNKNYEIGLYKTTINGKTTYIVDSYHPTSHGIWENEDMLKHLITLLKTAKELCNNSVM